MRNWLRQYEVWVFLVTIVVVNALFILCIHQQWLPKQLYNYGRFAILGAIMLSVVMCSRGLAGAGALLKPFLVWRVNPLWFIFAFCWASLIAFIILLGKGIGAGGLLTEINLNTDIVQRPSVMVPVLIGSFIGEIVWVSYAIGRLSRSMTWYLASAIVGVFWTLWWLPMAILNVGIIPGLKLGPLLVNMVGVALMCGWLYQRTRSGLCVLILQIMVNTSALLFPVMPTTGGATTYWYYAVVYFIASTLIYLILGPRPLFINKNKAAQQPGFNLT